MRLRAALPIALLSLVATTAHAQRVSGRVVDDSTRRPLAGAAVRLMTLSGNEVAAATSDRTGSWALAAPQAGTEYRVRVERIGYARIESAPFFVGADPVTVNLATREQVVMLEGISAQALNYRALLDRSTTRKSARTLLPDEVAARMERKRPPNPGRLVWGLIANLSVTLADWPMLPAPYQAGPARRRGPRPECYAGVAVDGILHLRDDITPLLEDIVDVADVRAVEIYDDPSFVPRELELLTRRRSAEEGPSQAGLVPVDAHGMLTSGPSSVFTRRNPFDAPLQCGVVVFWTHRGLGIP